MAGFKRQAEEQHSQFQKAKEQLTVIRENIEDLKKELEGKGEEVSKAEHATYKLGQKETEEGLKSQLIEVWQGFCLQVWAEALNTTRMDLSLELRNPERVIFPLALRSTASSSAPETGFVAPTFQPPAKGGKGSKAMEQEFKKQKGPYIFCNSAFSFVFSLSCRVP